MGRRLCLLILILPLIVPAITRSDPYPARASTIPVAVLTQHNDDDRSGANLDETILNTANVNVRQFGKLFTRPIDGQIYAQPLYVPGLAIPGHGIHNVVFVATMHNSVYAFDADDPAASAPLWHVNLGPSIPIPSPCFGDKRGPYDDIRKEVGIVSTPAIDLATHTMYVVSATDTDRDDTTCDPDTYFHWLHALDITTGREKFGGPVAIQASAPGTGPDSDLGAITFDNMQELQRPALLLANDMIYIGFGSYGATDPYHGWLLAYNARTLAQEAVFLSSPAPEKGDRYQGGIWQSGEGPAADAAGNVYVTTGNGYWNIDQGGKDYGDSVLRMTPTLSVEDWFTPFDHQLLDDKDWDLGSTGPLLIPGTHLLLQAGKTGMMYLLDQDDLGHYHAGSDSQIVQSLHATVSQIHASPACWPGARGTWCYLWGALDVLKAFALVNGKFQASSDGSGYAVPVSESRMVAPLGVPGGMLSISADGTAPGTGIVWATTPTANANWQTVPGILRAFDATDLSHELWDSEMDPARDRLGAFATFNAPTIANGKVYVGTFSGYLAVYGLLSAGTQPAPITIPAEQPAGGTHHAAPAQTPALTPVRQAAPANPPSSSPAVSTPAPSDPGPDVPAKGLVGYWPFDEGGGRRAADVSGSGNTGTLIGAVRWVPGHFGAAVAIDGTAYIAAGVHGLPAANEPQTISWWFNYATVPEGVGTSIALTNSAANSGVEIGFHNGVFGVWRYTGMLLATTSPPAAHVWHHAVYVFDGTAHELYVDGTLVSGERLQLQGAAPTTLTFGGGAAGASEALDDVRIYNRALSATEIAQLGHQP